MADAMPSVALILTNPKRARGTADGKPFTPVVDSQRMAVDNDKQGHNQSGLSDTSPL
ncbi:MAG: hypothetical protein ABW170_06295 [Candidatus Thiodiazotropha sp. L084R]